LKGVKIPAPKNANGERKQSNFGFIEYQHECSVDYAIQLFEGTSLFGQELQLKRRNSNKPGHQQQHHRQPAMQHHSSLPNMMTGMFPPGTFPIIQPPMQLLGPPGYFYPPMNPILGNHPANMMMFPSGFPAPQRHGSQRDVPLPLPPGESKSYRGDRHQGGANHHKRFYDDSVDSSNYHPIEKRSRYSDPSISRPRSGGESSRYSEGVGRQRSATYQHDDSHRESRSHHRNDDSRADRFRQSDHPAERMMGNVHRGGNSNSNYGDHNKERSSSYRGRDGSFDRRSSGHHADY